MVSDALAAVTWSNIELLSSARAKLVFQQRFILPNRALKLSSLRLMKLALVDRDKTVGI